MVARVHNVLAMSFDVLSTAEVKMSTTSHNISEANVPLARVPSKDDLTNAGFKAANSVGTQLLSRSILHDGSYACGQSSVSDDDLITAAQRGDQHAFVE